MHTLMHETRDQEHTETLKGNVQRSFLIIFFHDEAEIAEIAGALKQREIILCKFRNETVAH